MYKTKFTPGPWRYKEALPRTVEAYGHHRNLSNGEKALLTIADVGNGEWSWAEQTVANGHLIAAAPEMYELLDKCVSCLQHWIDGRIDEPMIGETQNTVNEIQNLLAKARGEE